MMADNIPSLSASEPTENGVAPTEERQDVWMQGLPGSSAMPAPIVGIPIPVRQSMQGPQLVADAVGAWALERMGARLLLVPLWPLPTHQQVYQSLWPLVQSIDGILLPAGVAESDETCRQETSMQAAEAQNWLSALVQLVTYLGMPLLAIADGAQLWNAALGGSSRQGASDTPRIAGPSSWKRAAMRVQAHSTLASLLASALPAHERDGEPPRWELAGLTDHQVECLVPGLRTCAYSEEEELIVAFERCDGAFGLGMSGRLEWELEQSYSRAVFATFLHACSAFDTQRSHHPAWEDARERICATLAHRVEQGQPLIKGGLAAVPIQPQPAEFARGAQGVTQAWTGQQRGRQRSALPTKEERNRLRRQRWSQQEMRRG